MQHCWQRYITHPRCQPFFQISDFILKYKKKKKKQKNICGTVKSLNFLVVLQKKNLSTLVLDDMFSLV